MSKVVCSASKVVLLTRIGDEAVKLLIQEVRGYMTQLFKICEAVAMLDMVRFDPWTLYCALQR